MNVNVNALSCEAHFLFLIAWTLSARSGNSRHAIGAIDAAAEELAVDGRRIAHWNTWGRADSATDGDQLFTTAGQTSCTGARAAAYRRTPTELSYDARGRCVQGS